MLGVDYDGFDRQWANSCRIHSWCGLRLSRRSASGPDGLWWLASACEQASRPGTSLRFVSVWPALLLLPYVLSQGSLALERLGWIGLAAIVLGGGAPVLLANAGLLFAPAAHAGALFPGVMPLAVAILAAAILREPFTGRKKIGFVLILLGVFCIATGAGGAIGSSADTSGTCCFSALALAWASATVAMRRAARSGCAARHRRRRQPLILYVPAYLFTGVAKSRQRPMGRYSSSSAGAGGPDGHRFSSFSTGVRSAILGASSGCRVCRAVARR